jgi:hypothetical protein
MSTTATEQTAQEIPKVAELGTTSAPLKSAAFFLGAYCKEFNGIYFTAFAPRWVLIGCLRYRGLYALQGREPRPGALSEGGPPRDAVCD